MNRGNTSPGSGLGKIATPRLALLLSFFAYLCVVALSIAHHEPWTDEAQSWLLARDSGFAELVTRLLRYEGSPGVWHSLLHLCILLGLPYTSAGWVSGGAALAGVALLLLRSPFPLWTRVLIPFTYLLAYQYAVIARSYALVPPLLFACAAFYPRWEIRIGRLTLLLVLLAGVSAHSYLIAVCIWVSIYIRAVTRWKHLGLRVKRRLLVSAGLFLLSVTLIAYLAWPNHDVTFARVPDYTFRHILSQSAVALQDGFGPGYFPLAILLLSVPLLIRGRGLLVFLNAGLLLCLFSAIEYSSTWHNGLLFLVWLFALWISAQPGKFKFPELLALTLAVTVQFYWLCCTVRYDWNSPYSGSLAAAQYIRTQHLSGNRAVGLGTASTGVQPYFARNIFYNVNRGRREGFWDWSTSNHADDAAQHLAALKPDYVLATYMSDPERKLWTHLVTASGYTLRQRFPGDLYGRDRLIQPDAMDLYAPGPALRDCSLASSLAMNDPAADYQLLWGFYELSDNTWRWTSRRFTVALNRPAGCAQRGATLHLKLYLPESEIQALGPMKLVASIASFRLRSMKFKQGGSYDYETDVPPGALFKEIVPVDFAFNKAVPPSRQDRRELGAVVSFVDLQSK